VLITHAPVFRPASSSIITAGNAGAASSTAPQSYLVLMRHDGNGANGFGYMYGQMPTGTINGPRFFYQDDGRLWFAAHSATANQPGRSLNASFYPGVGVWHWAAATWDGTSVHTGINLYLSKSVTSPLYEGTYFDGNSGSGAGLGGPGELITIGNRHDSARTLNGAIALLVRWNRRLSLQELELAKRLGPEAVRAGQVLLYANDQILVRNGVSPAPQRTGISRTATPNYNFPFATRQRVYHLPSTGPTLSLPGVQNITATTVTPKVTLTFS